MNINAVRLDSTGVITGFIIMYKESPAFFGWACVNSTFLGCNSLLLVYLVMVYCLWSAEVLYVIPNKDISRPTAHVCNSQKVNILLLLKPI